MDTGTGWWLSGDGAGAVASNNTTTLSTTFVGNTDYATLDTQTYPYSYYTYTVPSRPVVDKAMLKEVMKEVLAEVVEEGGFWAYLRLKGVAQ
jgi:hypothetical protein